MTEKGRGRPWLGGDRRTEDVGGQQSSHAEDFSGTGAFRSDCRHRARVFAACKGQHGTTRAGAVGLALSLVITRAVCRRGQRRDEREDQENERQRSEHQLHVVDCRTWAQRESRFTPMWGRRAPKSSPKPSVVQGRGGCLPMNTARRSLALQESSSSESMDSRVKGEAAPSRVGVESCSSRRRDGTFLGEDLGRTPPVDRVASRVYSSSCDEI